MIRGISTDALVFNGTECRVGLFGRNICSYAKSDIQYIQSIQYLIINLSKSWETTVPPNGFFSYLTATLVGEVLHLR